MKKDKNEIKIWNSTAKNMLQEYSEVYTDYDELNTEQFKSQFLFVFEKNYCNFKTTCKMCYAKESDMIFILNTDEDFRNKIKSIRISMIEEISTLLFRKAIEEDDTRIQMFLLEKFIANSNYLDKHLLSDNKDDSLTFNIKFV